MIFDLEPKQNPRPLKRRGTEEAEGGKRKPEKGQMKKENPKPRP
jgi:hypothetical protein